MEGQRPTPKRILSALWIKTGQVTLQTVNTLHCPLQGAMSQDGDLTQEGKWKLAKQMGVTTYCSRLPSRGSGRKESKHVTDAALGQPTSALELFLTPSAVHLEI